MNKEYGFIKRWVKDIRGLRWGFERSRIVAEGEPYMDRWIVYLAGYTVRLHKFYRGDDPTAPHDHPWDFWTFPLTTYAEVAYKAYWGYGGTCDLVERFRLHKREAEYRHWVVGRADGKKRPFYTIVFTARLRNAWGFWPEEDVFVPWREWSPKSDAIERGSTVPFIATNATEAGLGFDTVHPVLR